MTLRTKVVLAQVPLVVGLIVLGTVGSVTISTLGRRSQQILAENYRSVLAAQHMKEAIERIEGADRARFEQELRDQEQNITEPGEREATARLRARWTEYQRRPDAAARHAVNQAADEILSINEDAMVDKSDRASATARRLEEVLIASAAALLLLGFVASAAFTARLLRPLSVLSQAVRRLGEGDPAARARVGGSDEVALLAREFNTMADHLAQYRKSSLGELLQAQQAAQAAIDSLPDPVIILDNGGAVLNANQAAEALLRIAAEARDPLQHVPPPVREALDRLRAHVAAGRGAVAPHGLDEALRLPTLDGDRWFLPRAAPLYSESGAIAGVTAVLEDVTRLRRFDELKTDLVATVAHEFRTPLTSLRMAIHLLAEQAVGGLTEKQADLIFAAREDCERLQSIVDDVLDVARIQAGRMELSLRPVAAASLVEAAVDAHRAAAAERSITLAGETEPGAGDVGADLERVRLVFSNLLGNALRHTPSGGRIVVRARPGDDGVRFEVADSGEGIAREYQRAVFDKFFRIPDRKGGGAGLGLFIAKEVVEAHGGAIGVESEPGSGATFWFTLRRPAQPSS